MNWTTRLGTSFAACLLLVAVATPLASAEDVEPTIGYDFSKTAEATYAVQGETLTYLFELHNYGGQELTDVEVNDGACDATPTLREGDTDGDAILDPGETWLFACDSSTPRGVEPLVNTAGASATYGDLDIAKKAEFAMYPATVRKKVVTYFDYTDFVVYEPAGDVEFDLDLYLEGEFQGFEPFSMNQELNLWVVAGHWDYFEGLPLPGGYETIEDRWKGSFDAGPDLARHDNTLFNLAPWDLAIEKSGPNLAFRGDEITYEYVVTNTGPASVRPGLNDSHCGLFKVLGDENDNGLVDAGEEWHLTCPVLPEWTFPDPFINDVAVFNADYPYEMDPAIEGEKDWFNNFSSFALYPFVLRKSMFLYWDGDQTRPYDGLESAEFPVKAANDFGEHMFTISENAPAELWLAEGTWTFTEEYVPGYDTGYENIVYDTSSALYPDWTYPNVALFDLWVEKAGPVWSMKGDKVTYTYEVHNSGPASVTPVIDDDKCDPTYVGGDTDLDGLIDPTETWLYECTLVPTWTFPDPFTNTVKVWDEEGEGLEGWYLGGDTNWDNNTATFTLYPFVLRKAIFVYWKSVGPHPGEEIDYSVPLDGFEDVEFKVDVSRDGGHVGYLHISEDHEAEMFLSEGEWTFTEKDLPEGFTFASWHNDITVVATDPGSPAFIVGEGYPDYTFANVALFDLSVEKKLWWGKALPGKTIAYKYKVRNTGPAPVTPVLYDDKCAPIKYKWGDTDHDGLVDPGETWVFKCLYTVVEKPLSELTNTVTVWDQEGEKPDDSYLGGDTNWANNTDTMTLEVGWYACQTWCWRNHKHLDDWPDGYDPDMLVGKVFGLWKKLDLDRDGKPDTLEDALNYKGAKRYIGLKRMLLKAAVTALLNEAEYGDGYPAYDNEEELINEVRHVFRSKNRWKIKTLTNTLNEWNNGYCAL